MSPWLWLAASLALAAPEEEPAASAPTERAPPDPLPRRLPPTAVDSAFLTTHLSIRQGAGMLTVRDYEVEDLGTFDLQLVGGEETLEVQGRLSPWVALGARLGGSVVTGVNLDSVFLSGLDSGVHSELWLRIGLIQQRRTVLSLRVVGYGERGASLTPAALADAFARDRWDTLSAVLKGKILDYVLGQRRTISGGFGVSGARDLGREFSLQSSLTLRIGRVSYQAFGEPEDAVRASRTSVGGGVAVDWTPKGRIPLGGLIEVHNRQEAEGWLSGDLRASGTNRLLTSGTLAYTGRDDLHLGLSLGALFPTVRPTAEQLASVDLTLRYDF